MVTNHSVIGETLTQLKKQNLIRTAQTIRCDKTGQLIIDGKKYFDFASNDYLALANHPEVKQAVADTLAKHSIGSGAAHFISGHRDSHTQLIDALKKMLGAEKVLLFSSGYAANLAVFSALRDCLDWVLQDRLNHASLLDGNRLIGLPIRRYAHNDMAVLEKKIKEKTGTGLLVSDGVFSMDGDYCLSEKLCDLSRQYGSFLLIDDAHGFAMTNQNQNIINKSNAFYMATLGKAVGTMGAFVAGNRQLIDFLAQRARPYIYTTAISPIICMATIASLTLIKNGTRQKKLKENINAFQQYANQLNLTLSKSNSAIQTLIIGDNKKTLLLGEKLRQHGFIVGVIRPPTVPPNSARLRITLSAKHDTNQIKQLLTTLNNALA